MFFVTLYIYLPSKKGAVHDTNKEMASNAQAEYTFQEQVDALRCLICLDLASDPQQHEKCGKLFCKTCLEKHGFTEEMNLVLTVAKAPATLRTLAIEVSEYIITTSN